MTAEPALRQLDKGLPRLDMYHRVGKTPFEPPQTGRALVAELRAALTEARRALAQADSDRQKAAAILADAEMRAATILAEAEGSFVHLLSPSLPRIADIQKAVADRHGLSVRVMLGEGRSRDLTAARWEAVRACVDARPDLSASAIGKLFRRDHSFVFYALKRKKGAQ